MFTSISRLDKPFRCHIITLSPSRSQASLTCNNICNSMGKDTPEYRPLQGEEVETQTSSYIHYATNNIPPWGKFYFTFLHLLVAALVVTILFGPKNCSTYESKSSHGATWCKYEPLSSASFPKHNRASDIEGITNQTY